MLGYVSSLEFVNPRVVFISLQREVYEMILAVGLVDKTHTRSKSLSGGMKRKLSLAIALLGEAHTKVPMHPHATHTALLSPIPLSYHLDSSVG